jgi:hypothetical protein
MNDQSDMPIDVPAIGVSFKQTLDDYREVVFQTHLPRDCPLDYLNELLDRMSAAGDRQKAKTHLPTVKGLLDIKQAALKTETATLFEAVQERDAQEDAWRRQAIESGRRVWKPTPSQSQEHAKIQARIAQSQQNINVLNKEIDSYSRQLADMEVKLAPDGANTGS